MATIGKRAYAEMFGPTVGDRVRLADTELIIEVEKDYTLLAGGYGEEAKFGGGKTIRDGMSQSQRTRDGTGTGPQAGGAVDTVMTNALIIDHWGIVKADIGLKGGRIVAIGKAGNPDTQPGIDIIIGPGTEVISCEGNIVTAGGIDTHIHFHFGGVVVVNHVALAHTANAFDGRQGFLQTILLTNASCKTGLRNESE